jgi:uncharacterized RDD family membrane protein YckC
MDCPQCHNDEISPSGACLVCGYRLQQPSPASEADSRIPAPKSELPQWRLELSERLQTLKQKKDSELISGPPDAPPAVTVDPPSLKRNPSPKTKQSTAVPTPGTPAPQQKMLAPVAEPADVEKLIDKAVARQSAPSLEKQASAPASIVSVHQQPELHEDKLILLSRTLTGLIDLMFVTLCTGIFFSASDYFSGIATLDAISFAALFLCIYLIYSIFFLMASTQTIGMMITDLRVVGYDGRRPCLYQILARCFAYLPSLIVCGIGLALSLFDDENRCFHDRISRTRIIRI